MKKSTRFLSILGLGILLILSLNSCSIFRRSIVTGWGLGAFDSNGERIYFTATNENGLRITYSGGPRGDMMMGGGYLTCASCHGPDARGGLHTMMGMEVMDAPNIRWDSLAGEAEEGHAEMGDGHGGAKYDFEFFRMAVAEGKHPDGESLDEDMPRWNIGNEDLRDLADYLMTFE